MKKFSFSRRRALRLLLLGGGGALVAACGPASPVAPTPPAASVAAPGTPVAGPTSAPKMGGTLKVLAGGSRITLATGYDPTGLMNQGARAESLMFEGLTKIQDDFSIAPQLAESWTVSPDGKTYTFKMRSGVKFHNGRQMEGADV